MQIIEVNDKQTIDEFHRLPEKLHGDNPNWIPSLRMMVENTFDPGQNAKFKIGDAKRWLVKKDGVCKGRIAAFFDSDYDQGYAQPTGGCGFFECANDEDVAFLLFDTAKAWLARNGMQAMDGPINFGENFFHWGLLAEGFVQQTFGMQYHPEYYLRFFEKYGFNTFYEQYSYSLDVTHPDLPERFWKIAEWVVKKPAYDFRHFTFKNQDKFIADFIEIHRQAWNGHGNYKPVRHEQLKEMLRDAKLFLDEEFIWYVYHNGQPIAFLMMIPDLNQIIKKLGSGKLHLLNIIKLLYFKAVKSISRCRVIVLGVIPKYQNRGVESGIFLHLKKAMLQKPWYNDMEMSWVGDFNPKMMALLKLFGAKKTLTHLTMRYLFDSDKPFARAPIIE